MLEGGVVETAIDDETGTVSVAFIACNAANRGGQSAWRRFRLCTFDGTLPPAALLLLLLLLIPLPLLLLLDGWLLVDDVVDAVDVFGRLDDDLLVSGTVLLAAVTSELSPTSTLHAGFASYDHVSTFDPMRISNKGNWVKFSVILNISKNERINVKGGIVRTIKYVHVCVCVCVCKYIA